MPILCVDGVLLVACVPAVACVLALFPVVPEYSLLLMPFMYADGVPAVASFPPVDAIPICCWHPFVAGFSVVDVIPVR